MSDVEEGNHEAEVLQADSPSQAERSNSWH
jgi:hypothetical protein